MGSGPARAPQRARIVDVAALAGVSPQTVSNVINSRGGFTEVTRARVESAIADLGFQPNRYAQSLRSQRTQLLGFDMSAAQLDAANPFTVSFLRALIRVASHSGYRVIAFTHEDVEARDFRSSAASGAVDGFILSDSTPDDPRARVLSELEVPFVAFGRTAEDLPQTWVDIDNVAAMAAPVDRLVASGHRAFGYVGFDTPEYWHAGRLRGTVERLAHHGLPLPGSAMVLGQLDTLRQPLLDLLSGSGRPTAVVTSSDALAVQVVNTAHALGLRVGTDLAVTGFDAGPLRTMAEPTLTSVGLPVSDVAEVAVSRLLALLSRETITEGTILPTRLVLGGTA